MKCPRAVGDYSKCIGLYPDDDNQTLGYYAIDESKKMVEDRGFHWIAVVKKRGR